MTSDESYTAYARYLYARLAYRWLGTVSRYFPVEP